MERYSILERLSSPAAPTLVPQGASFPAMPAPEGSSSQETVRFPAEDGGRSLAEMAERDLEAALQLLAERAQYITGASGAAIAVRDGEEMICRASAGPSAPELGAQLQTDSGLSGESIRTGQILRCDDAAIDTRVNRESCRALGIASVVVMPLTEDGAVIGVFELFSERANAFEERDIVALQRIAEMIQTAMTHAAATVSGEKTIACSEDPVAVEVVEPPATEPEKELKDPEEPRKAERWSAPETVVTAHDVAESAVEDPSAEPAALPVLVPSAHLQIGKCEACGFPVSEGRKLCLDCEAAQKPDEPSSLGEAALLADAPQRGWAASHKYLLGVLLVVAVALAVLLRFR